MTTLATRMQNADPATTPKGAPLNELAEAQLQAILAAGRATVVPAAPPRSRQKRPGVLLAWIAVPVLTVGVITAVTVGNPPTQKATPRASAAGHTEPPGRGDKNGPTGEPTAKAPSVGMRPDVTLQAMWAFDVTDIAEIRAHADAIVDADVVSVSERAAFVFADNPLPYTEVRLRIHEVLKGSDFDSPLITVLYPGGVVTLRQVLDAYPRESTEKRGLTKLSDEELDRQTEMYGYDEDAPLVPGERYVLALGENEDAYAIGPAGFGVFHADGDIFTNAITGSRYSRADFQE